jgi:hypothetical protein
MAYGRDQYYHETTVLLELTFLLYQPNSQGSMRVLWYASMIGISKEQKGYQTI